MSRLIIVANRLPLSIEKTEEDISVRQSSGGLVSALKSYFEKSEKGEFEEIVWIGSSDISEDEWEEAKGSLENRDFTVQPVFIEKETYDAYYNGFSNSTLWPLFHYFPTTVEYDKRYFEAYMECNRIFADKASSIMRPDDVVWVHDYQLMAVPQLIRERIPDASIGFFLHIPFPAYEIFRLLPTSWKKTLLNGVLGADLIGFHTYDYVQYFIQSVKMILEADNHFNSITYHNRLIQTDLFPIGIDYGKFHEMSKDSLLPEYLRDIHRNFPDKKIIFSVDRLDYTKGLTSRLKGYEDFLSHYPEWHEKVVFIFNIVPSRDEIPSYSEMKRMVEEMVSTINGKYSTISWQPLMYRYNHLEFDELCALYRSADVALITPLRDGMNLVAKEYIASNKKRGVLILSEFTGAASELNEALLVNPTDSEGVAAAILRALTMPEAEQHSRLKLMQQRIQNYDVMRWVSDFLEQLRRAKEEQQKSVIKWLDKKTVNTILDSYHAAERRCLLIDYDGTLVPFSKTPVQAVPPGEITDLLAALAADPRNEVVVISGRDAKTLDSWLGHLNLSFVAEHGVFIRFKGEPWKAQLPISTSWKKVVRPILEMYVTRCAGSLIEEKKNTLTWHYRNTHPGLGFVRSRELLNSLLQLTANTPIQVIDGNKVLEIRLMGVDKGSTSLKIIDHFTPDFVLCIGDDTTDEDMFKALEGKANTIKVGQGATAAQYNIQTQQDVLPFFRRFLT